MVFEESFGSGTNSTNTPLFLLYSSLKVIESFLSTIKPIVVVTKKDEEEEQKEVVKQIMNFFYKKDRTSIDQQNIIIGNFNRFSSNIKKRGHF
jgi:hypothetical protein